MKYKVKIFTDGSCIRNPGPGGYGAIIIFQNYEKLFSAGYHLTTNNRMELMAVIIALKQLIKPHDVILTTDSQYVRQGITNWIYSWKIHNWNRPKNQIIKNIDLWKLLDELNNYHNIQWEWVKGHSGNLENERCDRLAYNAAIDPIYNDFGYIKY